MEKVGVRTVPASRENNGMVRRSPDRPEHEFLAVLNHEAQQIVGHFTRLPLTEVRVVRGRTVGGGMSREATQRARKRLAAQPS